MVLGKLVFGVTLVCQLFSNLYNMILSAESSTFIIVLVCICSVNTFQMNNDLLKLNESYNKTTAQQGGIITQYSQIASSGQPSSLNLKDEGDGKPTVQLHFVANSSEHMNTFQGPHANVLAGMLQSTLLNPQLISILMSVMRNKHENIFKDISQTILRKGSSSEETPLLSTLEKVLADVQYLLSPEGLESEDRCTADVSASPGYWGGSDVGLAK